MINLAAYLVGFSSRADKSASIRFATQELQPDEFVELQKHLNDFGTLVFQPGENQTVILPKERELDADKDKTPSKRLRAVIFRVYESKGSKEDFEVYYRRVMESIIKKVKKELPIKN